MGLDMQKYGYVDLDPESNSNLIAWKNEHMTFGVAKELADKHWVRHGYFTFELFNVAADNKGKFDSQKTLFLNAYHEFVFKYLGINTL